MKITTSKKLSKEELTIILIKEKESLTFPAKIKKHLEEEKKTKRFTGSALSTSRLGLSHLFIGLGKDFDKDMIRKAVGTAMKTVRNLRIKKAALDLTDERYSLEHIQAATEGALLGIYRYQEYKKSKDEPKDPQKLSIITHQSEAKEIIEKATIVCEGVLLARDLVNRPAADKPPSKLVELAKELGKKHGFSVKALGKAALEKEGCNALLAVSKGSAEEPFLCVLEYFPKKNEKPTCLVGKGVTFDAGGIQVKPGAYMNNMKSDMGGAATVLATMVTLARLHHDENVVGIMGLTENMLGAKAYKPDDIITAHNGKTIEIIHTDAEGRLVLADALSYGEKQYKPKAMIDLATLTGASLVAVGYRIASILGTDKELIVKIKDSSEATDELVWELPLRNHFREMMKGSISDLRNMPKTPNTYSPGTIVAAAFLSSFVEKTPWAHIDIAGTAYSYEETAYTPVGGTGWGVRLLTNMLHR